MTGYQERVLQLFRRILGWFAANMQYLADNPSLAKQVEVFSGIVTRITDHATAQETKHAQTLLISTDETEKREELESHMARIAKIARALRGTVPGITVLSMPKGNVSTPGIVMAATAMTEKAEIYKDVLVESGMPADFIEQLTAAAAALKASIDGRGLARASRVAATTGVESEMEAGRRVVAILDAIVTHLIRSEPSKLAEWKQLTRVTLKSGPVHGQLKGIETQSGTVETSSTPQVSQSVSVEKAA